MENEKTENENEGANASLEQSEFSLTLKAPEDIFKEPEEKEKVAEPEKEKNVFKEATPFDEYARDLEGNIKYKKDGTPQKKRGRKRGHYNKAPDAEELTQKQLSTTLTGMVYALGQIVYDAEEWTPGEQEFLQNRNALLNVLKKRKITASAETQCVVSFGTSILSRLGKEKTSAKIKSFWRKLGGRIRGIGFLGKMKKLFKRKKEKNDKQID